MKQQEINRIIALSKDLNDVKLRIREEEDRRREYGLPASLKPTDKQIFRKAWLNHMAEEKKKARRAERIILVLVLIGSLAAGFFGTMAVRVAYKNYAASLRN